MNMNTPFSVLCVWSLCMSKLFKSHRMPLHSNTCTWFPGPNIIPNLRKQADSKGKYLPKHPNQLHFALGMTIIKAYLQKSTCCFFDSFPASSWSSLLFSFCEYSENTTHVCQIRAYKLASSKIFLWCQAWAKSVRIHGVRQLLFLLSSLAICPNYQN